MNTRRVVYNESQNQFIQDVDSYAFLGKMMAKANDLDLKVSSS